MIGIEGSEPSPVGSKPDGKNEWGVVDLMGNVWEWTSSELEPYPGSNAAGVEKKPGKSYVLRGGSAHEKLEDVAKLNMNAAFRIDWVSTKKEKTVGFRLVRSQ